MNFFSKLAMFATLSTVMFSGFAMDSGDFPSLADWLESAPAVTEDVVVTVVTPAVQQVVAQAVTEEAAVVTPAIIAPSYKEQAIQLFGTATDKAKTAYAATKGFVLNSKDSVVNFGANSYEAGKGFVVGSYELAKNDPYRFGFKTTGALVITGLGALALYNVYSVVKGPKALEAIVPATKEQTGTPALEAEQVGAPVKSETQEVEQAVTLVVTETTTPAIVTAVVKPAAKQPRSGLNRKK